MLRRIPLPEEIPNPKELARFMFGPPSRWEFIREMDVQRASARSPSLRAFLLTMGRLLGVSVQPVEDSVARSVSRNVIAGLLAEIVPSETIVWRTVSGDAYAAADLRNEIESGTAIGQQYAFDLLRISRDFLRRMANRVDAIAQRLLAQDCLPLFADKATREELFIALGQSQRPLFPMSHGRPDQLRAQHGDTALSVEDMAVLGARPI